MNKTAMGCMTLAVLSAIASFAFFWTVIGGPMVKVMLLNSALVGWHKSLETEAFTPPADDRVTQAQLDRLLRVAAATEAAIGGNLSTLEADTRWALGGNSAMENGAGYFAREEHGHEAGRQMVAAREAQVAAMDAEQMSKAELDWLNRRVMLALFGTSEMPALYDALKRGVGWPPAAMPNPTHPDAALMLPRQHEIAAWMRVVGVLDGMVYMLDRPPVPSRVVEQAATITP